MELGTLTFAMTLNAVDKRTGPISRFDRFGRLPPEIRIRIWEELLPAPEDESGAIFTQRHSYTWANDGGQVCEPGDWVPIRMTTTCAALLHVNKESRYLILRWAASLGYKLCFRVLCCDIDDLYDDSDDACDENPERKVAVLPVHGPIFIRPWTSTDILDIVASVDDQGFPDEWAEQYVEGEKLHSVQHLAINIDDLKSYMESRWFFQLLGAMPNLKTLSIDCEPLMEADGEAFRSRSIEVSHVGDPWTAVGGREEHGANTSLRPTPICRWEAGEPEPGDLVEFEKFNFKDQLLEGFLDEDYWPQGGGAYEYYRDENGEPGNPWLRGVPGYEYLEPRLVPERKQKVLESLPPWIWDHDRGEFAFGLRVFKPAERRGYDDVSGGFVVDCGKLYGLD